MELFRITRSEFKNDLSGEGAFRYGGRWNSPGNRMIYSSSKRSLAMLEIMVHWQQPTPPRDFMIVVIFVPDALVSNSMIYPVQDWREDQQWSREAGDKWLAENSSLTMRVPSVIVPAESNYLINPKHPHAEHLKIIDVEPFTFDGRLFLSH